MKTLVICITLLIVIIFVAQFVIKINKIDCISQNGTCSQVVLESLSTTNQLSTAKTKNEIQNKLQKLYIVNSFSMSFKFPSIIVVRVVEKKPSIALKESNSENSDVILLDNDGLVLMTLKQTDLPTLITDRISPKEGMKVSDEILFAEKILILFSNQYQTKTALLSGDKLIIEANSTTKGVFPLFGDSNILMDSFNYIFSRLRTLKSSSKIGEVIDMRFKNPVIKESLD